MTDAAMARQLTEIFLEIAERYSLRDPDRIACHGVTLSECYTLRRLHHSGGLQVTEVSALFGWNKSTASRVVRSLLRKKLVRAAADERHHRAKRISVTPKGQALVARIETDVIHRYEKMLANFPAEALAQATPILRSWLNCLSSKCTSS